MPPPKGCMERAREPVLHTKKTGLDTAHTPEPHAGRGLGVEGTLGTEMPPGGHHLQAEGMLKYRG